MNFSTTLFSADLVLVSLGLMLMVLLWAIRQVSWRRLPAHVVGVWMAGAVILTGMWLVKAGLQTGLSFHLLGAAIFTLLSGAPLALLLMALVLCFAAVAGQLEWASLGLNFCFTVLPAVAVVRGALTLAQRYLPSHLFVYVFVNAFMAGGLSLFVAALSGMLLLVWQGVYDWAHLLDNALPFYFLLSWSEAFTTGLVVSILVVYRPEWVRTFDDERYLGLSGPK